MVQIVNRYKTSPALDSYQVENEFFLRGFGLCEEIPGALERRRLVNEFDLVRRLDNEHRIIIDPATMRWAGRWANHSPTSSASLSTSVLGTRTPRSAIWNIRSRLGFTDL